MQRPKGEERKSLCLRNPAGVRSGKNPIRYGLLLLAAGTATRWRGCLLKISGSLGLSGGRTWYSRAQAGQGFGRLTTHAVTTLPCSEKDLPRFMRVGAGGADLGVFLQSGLNLCFPSAACGKRPDALIFASKQSGG